MKNASQTYGARLRFTLLNVMAAALAILTTTPRTFADVITGTASSNPLTVNVSSTLGLTALVSVSATANINAQPLPTVSGVAPSPFNLSGTTVYAQTGAGTSVALPLNVLAVSATTAGLSTGLLTGTAFSNVTGLAGTGTTRATSQVDGLNFRLGEVNASALSIPLLSTDVIRISGSTISSSATVTGAGTGSPFNASFQRSVEDLNIQIFGVSIISYFGANFLADLEAGANVDVSVGLGSVSITLPAGLTNLVMSGTIRVFNDGVTLADSVSGSASATALGIDISNVHITSDVFSGANVIGLDDRLNASFRVATVQAAEAVPEPSTALLFIAGAGLLVLRASGRRCGRKVLEGRE